MFWNFVIIKSLKILVCKFKRNQIKMFGTHVPFGWLFVLGGLMYFLFLIFSLFFFLFLFLFGSEYIFPILRSLLYTSFFNDIKSSMFKKKKKEKSSTKRPFG